MTKKTTKKQSGNSSADLRDRQGNSWLYSDIVKEHFFNPRNFMHHDEEKELEYNGQGRAGSPACGDEMIMWIKVDTKTNKIKDCRWRTFGCGSAIASTSVLSEMITENDGMHIDQAIKIKPQDILERLGGLPDIKVHCSVLGDQALQKAIKNYQNKHK
ncbi:MAG: iron-sulfur cluster assembly scaffold protein [bacterium]